MIGIFGGKVLQIDFLNIVIETLCERNKVADIYVNNIDMNSDLHESKSGSNRSNSVIYFLCVNIVDS